MAIVDNRTVVDLATSAANYVGTSLADDTEIVYQGSNSVAENMTNSTRTILYNATSTQNWSNNTFLILVNCGIVGLLNTIAAGGFTVRFTGASTGDFFEVYVGGSDSWPTAFAGGWVYFVVDIEVASASPSNTGGTAPATTAIQHVGITATTAAMTRNVDNTWLNGIWRLPSGTPGILVEGQNTGSVDWTFADIESASETNLWGTFRNADGGAYVSSVPLRIGNSTDSVTHGFTDTNQSLLWQTAPFLADGYYGVEVVGSATNTINTTWGVKTGTGTDATGAQGILIQSDAGTSGLRWYLTANSNIDSFNAYGCTFVNGETSTLDNDNVETISSTFLNCNEAIQSSGATTALVSSLWQRNSVIDANTLDGVGFLKSEDLDNIKYSSFQFSDGHAIEITATTGDLTSETLLENTFTGYSSTTGSTDAAIYNNSGNDVQISSTGGNLVTTSYRNGTSATTTITASITITLTNMKDNTEVRVYETSTLDNTPPYSTPTQIAGIENATAGSTDARTFAFSLQAGTGITIRTFNINWIADDIAITPTISQEVQIAQRSDRVFSNPT